MKMYETTQPVEKYLNIPLECDCGRTHYAPIKAIDIRSGSLNALPDYLTRFGYKNPYILCDSITYEIAGKKCESLLKEANFSPVLLVIKHLNYDEATLGEIVLNKPDDCDVMIACGTGQITDILRFSSFKLGVPCFTVATAAPMDGYSASVGIMNVDNLKATMPAHCSEVIIGDTDILKGAPFRMTIAGFGDLIGKLNSLNDWRLGALINGEHHCDRIDRLVFDYVWDILEKVEKIKAKDPEAIGDIMNALMLAGLSTSLYGTSRAISGAEHHMSHYWEVVGDQQGKQFAMHGEQVAVGTVLALTIAEELKDWDVDFAMARAKAKEYTFEDWKENISRVYGNAADAIIELEKKTEKNNVTRRLERIDTIESKWTEIKDFLNTYSSSKEVERVLNSLGCPCKPRDIGINDKSLKDTLMYCKETRGIYTILSLTWDLGIMDRVSDKIIKDLNKEG